MEMRAGSKGAARVCGGGWCGSLYAQMMEIRFRDDGDGVVCTSTGDPLAPGAEHGTRAMRVGSTRVLDLSVSAPGFVHSLLGSAHRLTRITREFQLCSKTRRFMQVRQTILVDFRNVQLPL